jgi:hypothetical protein
MENQDADGQIWHAYFVFNVFILYAPLTTVTVIITVRRVMGCLFNDPVSSSDHVESNAGTINKE